MANTPVCADNLLRRPERRGKVRYPLGALAYLDIGIDNGGIVLDLSEDGLGLQAVAPLFGQSEVNLRIQLPQCEMRIETAARIVWLSDSSRLAGVRFENLSAATRARIRDWIETHGLPDPSAGRPIYEVEGERPSLPKGAPAMLVPPGVPLAGANSSRERWLSLIAEFEQGLSRQPAPAEEVTETNEPTEVTPSGNLPQPEPPVAAAASPDPTTLHPKPEIVSWGYGSSGLLASSRQARQRKPYPERSSGTPAEKPPFRRLDAPASDSVPAPTPSKPAAGLVSPGTETKLVQPVAGSALPAAPTVALTPAPRAPSFGYISPSLPNTEAAGARSSLSTRPAPATKLPEKRRRNQAIAVALFAVFAILCFGIGTWVGRQPGRHSPAKIEASVPPVEVTAEASAPSTSVATPVGIKPAGIQEARKSEASRGIENPARSAAAGRIHAPLSSAGSKALLPKGEALSANSAGPSPVPPRGAPQPAENSQPALFSPVPESQRATPQVVAQPPSSSAEAPAAPAPQVVDGYTLKPSDRFNPCHLTYRFDPTYPPEAKQKGIEGVVKIHLVIAADGSVQSEQLISGPGPLVSAAMDAAKYWRYFPALLNGQAIPTETDIAIAFRLPH